MSLSHWLPLPSSPSSPPPLSSPRSSRSPLRYPKALEATAPITVSPRNRNSNKPVATSMPIATLRLPDLTQSSTKTGFTRDGHKFCVPRTPDMFYTLTHPSLWGPSELLVVVTMTFNLILYSIHAPISFHLSIFFFWRIAYNLGLGLVLRWQSHSSSCVNWIQSLSSKTRGLIFWAVSKSLGGSYRWMKTPVEFNAWIAFRALAMLVLANDGWTYTLLVMRCWQPIMLATWLDSVKLVVCLAAGTLLVGLCCWVKASAHDCVGDFAWYWGDFFFTIDGSFTSSGVFRFFPHPMYTVGYSAYYGFSLITRSYTLLAVSLTAHLGQIAFLILVEEPHMQKIYASTLAICTKEQQQQQEKQQQEERPEEMIGFSNFSVFRSSDFALAITMLTTVGTSIFAPVGKKFHIIQLLFWWSIHWLGLGTILKLQSTTKFWTRHFERHGMTYQEAYTQWKRIFNFSVVMNKTAFALAIIDFARNPFLSFSSFFSSKSLAYLGVATSLILMSFYCSISVKAALGSYGYFYGDFFVPPKSPIPTYSHIYRYTNNAELLFGHLAHYGVALIMRSRPVLLLSMGFHLLHFLFVYNVELPHFRRLYKNHRDTPALQESVSRALADLGERVPILRTVYTKIRESVILGWTRTRATVVRVLAKGLKDAKRIIVETRRYMMSEKSRVRDSFKNSRPYRRVIKIGRDVRDGVKRFDGEDIVKLLERRGVRIEYVEDCDMSSSPGVKEDYAEERTEESRSSCITNFDKEKRENQKKHDRANLRHRTNRVQAGNKEGGLHCSPLIHVTQG